MTASGASSRAVAAARDAIARIETEDNHLDAARAALQLYEGLRDAADEAAEVRGRLVVAIIDSEAMSREQLGRELGISGRRVGQIYQEAKRRA